MKEMMMRNDAQVSKAQIYSSLFMFIFINGLFLFKYLSRVNTIFAIVLVCIYVMTILYLSSLFYTHRLRISSTFNLGLIILYVCSFLLFFWYIPKESFQPDRWSVITSFWNFAMDGKYPYFAKSFEGNYPGPMPVYFILAFPFYLTGEIGLFSISGLLLLFYFLYKKKNDTAFIYSSLLLLSSGAIFWEISCRSAMLINAVLIYILLYYLVDIKGMNKKKFWMSAIIGGLLLAIRTSFSLVFVVWGIYVLKNKLLPFHRLFVWGIIFIFSFLLTFLPLVLIFPNDFFIMNPFIIQSSFLIPINWIPLFFIVAIIAGFLCKKNSDVIYYSGLTLLVVVLIYFFYHIAEEGVRVAYLGSIIDISYFIMAMPFILHIASSQVQRQ